MQVLPAEDLHSTLSLLQDVCENATVGLFVMNERQHCIYMNRSAELMTGFNLSEVEGRPLHDFIHHHHPDGRPYPLEECPIDRAAPQNNQQRGEEVFIRKDGSFFPVVFTASPIRREGKVLGTVIEVQDISAWKQQEAEREAMRQISLLILQELEVEKIVQAVTDTATRLTRAQFGAFFYNATDHLGRSYSLYTLSGVPREKFSRFPMPRETEVFAPTFRGEGTVRVADIRRDPRYGKMSPYYGMPHGHLPVSSYLAVPVKLGDGQVVGGLFFGHEVPGVFTMEHERLVESLAAQAAIGVNKAKLFDAAHQARLRAEQEAKEKDRLYKEAAEANRLKDQFLATVSHELRTPLTSILGWTKMLAMGRLSPEMIERAISTIDRNARAQAQIVEDLLDISRIVSGKLRLNVLSFPPLPQIEAAVESVRPVAITKEIHLQLLVDPQIGSISGDPERLQQIVWNLVSNAVKFTPQRGQVQVTAARLDTHMEISVRDTGAGIAPEFLPHVFDRFSQLDSSSTREHGGLGLGLAIVRQLVEMQGGSVRAYSEGPGQGAEFKVCLPLASSLSQALSSELRIDPCSVQTLSMEQMEQHDLSGCRVLLVEDDPDARHLLASVLEGSGAQVEACASAEEGLLREEGFEPQVVISDIGMPGKDGYYFIQELRKRERAAERSPVPAIALTAFARVEDRMRALTQGFQMHVAKPVEPAELLAVVASLKGWRRT